MSASSKTVGILIYDGVEVLDFCGPFEVFSVTRVQEQDTHLDPSPFRVLLIAESMQQAITTAGGMQVLPHASFENCPSLDILVVPGGYGSLQERYNPKTLEFLKQQQPEVLASVCTGSLLLGQARLLDGQRATTHLGGFGFDGKRLPRGNSGTGQALGGGGRTTVSVAVADGNR